MAIVPIRGVTRGLAENLRSVADSCSRIGGSLVVVNNGTNERVLFELKKQARCEVHVAREARVGSYRARNRGLEYVLQRGFRRVLFTDADCVVSEEWAENLTERLKVADIVQGGSVFECRSPLGRAANCDYQARKRIWFGGELTCGLQTNSLDTRSCGIRARVFTHVGLFDRRLSYAGDAHWGRRAIRKGFEISGYPRPMAIHRDPTSWLGVYMKFRRIAMALTRELRYLDRRDVIQLLPEHAHLLIRPRAGRAYIWEVLQKAVGSVQESRDFSIAAYTILRQVGWQHGRRCGTGSIQLEDWSKKT